jgi:hypothetical protein
MLKESEHVRIEFIQGIEKETKKNNTRKEPKSGQRVPGPLQEGAL